MITKALALLGVSYAAAIAASPAIAQTSPEAAAAAEAQAAEAQESQDIIVTATGRSAALQDIPIAVTAVSGEQLLESGASDLRDVTQLAPALRLESGQSSALGAVARIRGIGTFSDNAGFEGAVGIFIDGVYRPRAGSALSDLPEVERVEILRGPQGTLFGRNTSAGAISVVTKRPSSDFGLFAEATIGFDELELLRGRAAIDIPLSETVAARVDGTFRYADGYVTDVINKQDINNRDRWSIRGQLLWDLTPDASLRIIADRAKINERCCGAPHILYGPFEPIISLLSGGGGAVPGGNILPIDFNARRVALTPGRTAGDRSEEWGVSAELDWNFGDVRLTSITAYRDWESSREADLDFATADIYYWEDLRTRIKNFSQEVRLQGEAGILNWLVGGYYGDERLGVQYPIQVGRDEPLFIDLLVRGSLGGCSLFDPTAPSFFACVTGNPALAGTYLTPNSPGQGQQRDKFDVRSRNYAAFTHNEIELTSALMLTLGARYTRETKRVTSDLLSTSNACTSLQAIERNTGGGGPGMVSALAATPLALFLGAACSPIFNPITNGVRSGGNSEGALSGTASLSYDINEDVMIYAGYSRGYKSGGYNLDRSAFPVRPQTIDASTLNVEQLRFRRETTDAYEVGLRTTPVRGVTFNVTGYYQTIKGLQLNIFNGFNFNVQNVPEVTSQGIEIDLSARPIEGLSLSGGVSYNDAEFATTTVYNPGTIGEAAIDKGTPLPFAPKWSVTGAVSYTTPVSDSLKVSAYLDGRYSSSYRTITLGRDPVTDNGSYFLFNGNIGIGSIDERWEVELFSRNILNERYFVGALNVPIQPGTFAAYPNEPRTYGVTTRFRF